MREGWRSGLLVALTGLSCTVPRGKVAGESCELTFPSRLGRPAALDLVRRVDRLNRGVAELLHRPVEVGVIVEVADERYLGGKPGRYGGTARGPHPKIRLASASLDVPEVLDLTVAHELVHYYLRGCTLDQVPYQLEEGLAWCVSQSFSPDVVAQSIGHLWPEPVLSKGLLDLSLEDVRELNEVDRMAVHRAATALVQSVGVEAILDMLLDCKVSAEERATLEQVLDEKPALQTNRR